MGNTKQDALRIRTISTIMYCANHSYDLIRGCDCMQLSAANRATCSANKVFNPIKLDHMLVTGAKVCTIPRHEQNSLWSISQKPAMLELSFFRYLVSRWAKQN